MAVQRLGNNRSRFNYGYVVGALLVIQICYMAKVNHEFDSRLPKRGLDIGNLPPSKNGQIEHENHFDRTDDEQAVKENITHAIVQDPITTTSKYGISIVRCKENSTWVSQLSSDWIVRISEKCGEVASNNFSVSAINKGAEDISAHMRFIVDNYDHLPPTLIFLQPDAFRGYRSDRTCAHTPFLTIKELTKAVDDHLSGGYLSLSPSKPLKERLVGEFYHGRETNRTWSIIFPDGEPITQQTVSFGHGSHFAVSRDRVLSRHRSVYANIEHFILEENADARRRACAVERLLHVLFGEPIIIPKESYMRNFIEKTEGCPD